MKDRPSHYHYRIEPGDTVWGVARKFLMTTLELIERNPWLAGRRFGSTAHYTIYPGETLLIPTRNATAARLGATR